MTVKKFGGKQENAGRKERPVIECLQSIAWVHAIRHELRGDSEKLPKWNQVAAVLRDVEDKSITYRMIRYYKKGERSPSPALRRKFPAAHNIWKHGPDKSRLWDAIKGNLKLSLIEFMNMDNETPVSCLSEALVNFHAVQNDQTWLTAKEALKAADDDLATFGLAPDLIIKTACHYADVYLINDHPCPTILKFSV